MADVAPISDRIGIGVWRGVVKCNGISSGDKSKHCALLRPSAGNPLQQPLDGQGAGLSTLHDGLDDVRGKIAEAQKATDMGVVELETSCDFRRVRIGSAAETVHPGLGSGDCENEFMVDASWGAIASPGDYDLAARAGSLAASVAITSRKLSFSLFLQFFNAGSHFLNPRAERENIFPPVFKPAMAHH